MYKHIIIVNIFGTISSHSPFKEKNKIVELEVYLRKNKRT